MSKVLTRLGQSGPCQRQITSEISLPRSLEQCGAVGCRSAAGAIRRGGFGKPLWSPPYLRSPRSGAAYRSACQSAKRPAEVGFHYSRRNARPMGSSSAANRAAQCRARHTWAIGIGFKRCGWNACQQTGRFGPAPESWLDPRAPGISGQTHCRQVNPRGSHWLSASGLVPTSITHKPGKRRFRPMSVAIPKPRCRCPDPPAARLSNWAAVRRLVAATSFAAAWGSKLDTSSRSTTLCMWCCCERQSAWSPVRGLLEKCQGTDRQPEAGSQRTS